MIEIQEATKSQAAEIAKLIMMAMKDDCCLYFCGYSYVVYPYTMTGFNCFL